MSAEVQESSKKGKGSKQKKDDCPRRLNAYGGYAHASYHVLHAVYIIEQTSDNGADYAK